MRAKRFEKWTSGAILRSNLGQNFSGYLSDVSVQMMPFGIVSPLVRREGPTGLPSRNRSHRGRAQS